MPDVDDGIFGGIEQHSWPSPAHDFSNLLALLRGIAVDRAFFTRPLVFSEVAMAETLAGKFGQSFIFLRHSVQLQVMAAIKRYHFSDGLLLSFYSIHGSFIKSISLSKRVQS